MADSLFPIVSDFQKLATICCVQQDEGRRICRQSAISINVFLETLCYHVSIITFRATIYQAQYLRTNSAVLPEGRTFCEQWKRPSPSSYGSPIPDLPRHRNVRALLDAHLTPGYFTWTLRHCRSLSTSQVRYNFLVFVHVCSSWIYAIWEEVWSFR